MGTKRNNKMIQTKKKICDEVWNEQLYLKFYSLIDVRNSDVKTKVDLVACRIHWINKKASRFIIVLAYIPIVNDTTVDSE